MFKIECDSHAFQVISWSQEGGVIALCRWRLRHRRHGDSLMTLDRRWDVYSWLKRCAARLCRDSFGDHQRVPRSDRITNFDDNTVEWDIISCFGIRLHKYLNASKPGQFHSAEYPVMQLNLYHV